MAEETNSSDVTSPKNVHTGSVTASSLAVEKLVFAHVNTSDELNQAGRHKGGDRLTSHREIFA